MSLTSHILLRLGGSVALVVLLFALAGNNVGAWSLFLTGLVGVVLIGAALLLFNRSPRPASSVASGGWISSAGCSLSKSRLATAVVAAMFLAVPGINLLAFMLIFPVLFFAIVALVASLAPLAILAAAGLQALGLRFDVSPLVEAWIYCTILWIGSALGMSGWEIAGRAIGAKGAPFLETLFLVWIAGYRWLIG